VVDGVVVEHHSGAYGVVAQLHSVAYGAVVPHHSERDGAVAVDWTLDAGVTESPVELDGRALQDSVRGCAEEEQRSLGRGAEQPRPGAFSWEPEPSAASLGQFNQCTADRLFELTQSIGLSV